MKFRIFLDFANEIASEMTEFKKFQFPMQKVSILANFGSTWPCMIKFHQRDCYCNVIFLIIIDKILKIIKNSKNYRKFFLKISINQSINGLDRIWYGLKWLDRSTRWGVHIIFFIFSTHGKAVSCVEPRYEPQTNGIFA